MTNLEDAFLWRRLDREGHEAARLLLEGSKHLLQGAAVFEHRGEPCRLDYAIECAAGWETRLAVVSGWTGERTIEIEIRSEGGRWRLNGADCPEVEGAIDVDLNFSPSTNLLPIRRLMLEAGAEAEVKAAWLRFPELDLVPLEQTYRRLGPSTYRYQTSTGFTRDLEVRPSGLVAFYPDFCEPAGPA